MIPRSLLALSLAAGLTVPAAAAGPPVKILFLGDTGHHQPAARFKQLQPVLAARGIDLTYTDRVADLNPKTLAHYDGLMIYANITAIDPDQESALLGYVAGGKGLIPVHCASYCFLNSPKYVELVGAQFQRHQTGTFRTRLAKTDHPILRGFGGFESWDETYVHHKHNKKDRTVLEYRDDAGNAEPWTWVRTHGTGRVFYTAWGHDQRTWANPGFHNLLERGIRWAVGGDPGAVPAFADRPTMTARRADVKPFTYVPARVPFYAPDSRTGSTTDPTGTMQTPLDPAESMKHLVHPTDFEVTVFATEAQLGGKPICMNWDERGRLWVAVTVDYPNEKQPEGQGRDKIVVLEDADGDGVADKVTVFADRLSIPTSLVFHNGGVLVHQAPHTLFLKDTDGDGVADERRVVFTGWSTGDTHAGPSNLRYGLDNWVWGMVGYAGFDGTVGGEKHSFRQGFLRFKPDGSKLEFVRGTNNNSWGVGLSEEGIVFGSTANGNPSVYMPIPNRYYEAVRGWSSTVLGGIAGSPRFSAVTEKVRQVDWHGQFTAAAGHALYTARDYPKTYWNRTAFVAEPTGHLCATFEITPDGADFTSKPSWNLLASDDEWTAPIMAEVGPDGQVWVIDWYNYIVQHNPTPNGFKNGRGNAYETDLRDKTHGRIYRVVSKTSPGDVKFTLKGATPEALVETLKNPNMFWRTHAQRLLVERGRDDVVPALVTLATDRKTDEIGLNVGAIHALWTLHGLGAIGEQHPQALAAAVAGLRHPSAGVRRNAVLVLPRTSASAEAVVTNGVLNDRDAQVRLAALLALAEMPADAAVGAAVAETLNRPENSDDRWIQDAATSAAAAHDRHFLRAVIRLKTVSATNHRVTAIVTEHFARGGPGGSVGDVLADLADGNPVTAAVVLGGLSKGWPAGTKAALTAGHEKAMLRLLAALPADGKARLVKLAVTLGSTGFEQHAAAIVDALLAAAADGTKSEPERAAAARQVAEFRPADGAVAEKLLEVLTPQTPPAVALAVVESLGASTATTTGAAVVRRFPSWTPPVRKAAVKILLARPESTRALLDGAEKGQISLGELALDQKQALSVHPDRDIAGRAKALLAKGGGLPNPDRDKVLQQLMPLTKRPGDPDLGKLVFKAQCAKCHKHGGEGNSIGPDLTGMAVHTREHLLTDIIDPSRSVEGNFRVYVVETADGKLITGLLASENKTAVELVDSEAKKTVVLRQDIAALTASNRSLMPDGFEKQVKEDDLVNLLAFLTRRGKYLPLPLDKVATAVSTRGMFYDEQNTVERLVFPDWAPKSVDGVPFNLVDPQGDRRPNAILLYGPLGTIPPRMPHEVRLPCNAPAKAIHLLSGVSGWGYPGGTKGSVSLIVRLHYDDGTAEDHRLTNGRHFADYISRVDVPESRFAFDLAGRQMRYLAVTPKRAATVREIEFVKGKDQTAPVVMAVTVELRE